MPDPINHPEEYFGIEDPRITYVEELKKYGRALDSMAKLQFFEQPVAVREADVAPHLRVA